ncbi:MAG TPA: DUF1801 domain-containing protein [Devosia sp.]|nr:DUF1801 domain-containing protein [Devosia sp.]
MAAPAKSARRPASRTFTSDEVEAMEERAREMKAARKGKADGEQDLLAKVAEMAPSDRAMAERIHALVKTNAPALSPKTWYGMPAYANTEGKVVCFFQPAERFKTRYATFGFNDAARLDDGAMWPTAFALARLTPADEQRIAALVKKAAG